MPNNNDDSNSSQTEQIIESLGRELLNSFLSHPDIQTTISTIVISDIGREPMDHGDEGDDPLFWATHSAVVQKILLQAALHVRFFPERKA